MDGADTRRIRLSIPTKIFLGFAGVLILLASVLAFNYAGLGRLYEEVSIINRGLVPLRLTLFEIEGDLRSYAVLVAERDPVVLRSAVLASRVLFPFPRRITERLDRCLQTLDQLAAPELAPSQSEGVLRLKQIVEALQERTSELWGLGENLIRALEAEDAAAIEAARRPLFEHLARLQGQIRSLSSLTDGVVNEALDSAARQGRRNALVLAVTTAGAMGVALLAMLWAARTLRPLTRLTEGVKSVRAGAYPRVQVESRNEIGVLAEEFNDMVRALEERDRKLREGREALERAYQVAIDAERLAAIGRLTSQITHEIRNPLSSIGLNMELLEDELRDSGGTPESLELVRTINVEVDRLAGITQEYLQFARLPRPQKQPESINRLVQDLLRFHEAELERAGVDVVLDLDPEVGEAPLDAGQIRQAVLNLVRNARDAMPRGGRVTVRTRRTDDTLELTVVDEGEGISEQARDRIFDPFFTTKPDGTGLGLPLTRQIAVQHGGQIRCEGGPDGGASFILTLPLAA